MAVLAPVKRRDDREGGRIPGMPCGVSHGRGQDVSHDVTASRKRESGKRRESKAGSLMQTALGNSHKTATVLRMAVAEFLRRASALVPSSRSTATPRDLPVLLALGHGSRS
jgi:hypothetical protein